MGMTITEKILAAHAGLDKVVPGQLIRAKVDICLGNDVTSPVAINQFAKIGVEKVFDKDKVAMVPDHFLPAKDIQSATMAKQIRLFAKEQELSNYFEVGKMGIEHVLLPEQGVVGPGDVVIGADSHTCTYGALGAFSTGVGSTDLACAMATGDTWFKVPEQMKFTFKGKRQPWVMGKDFILKAIGMVGVDGALYRSMEFTGEGISDLSQDGRFTIANMAIEAGAKNGIIVPDAITKEYVEGRFKRPAVYQTSDPDAVYQYEYEIDLTDMEPQVAKPHLPENVVGVSEIVDVKVDQVVIGSCTNGRMEDLRVAAEILKGRKVADGVRLIVFPGSQQIWLDAMREGLFDIIVTAGGAVSTPTCGPCLGGHMGILAEGERAVTTTNRNFVGRMGHPKSEVYLASPAVAAASAVLGRIGQPKDLGM